MNKIYHVLGISGGKDSTALAFYMKENMPDIFDKMELVFADTECEMPETYEYLNKIELFLNKQITRIIPQTSFEFYLDKYGYLPSKHGRWCTTVLKRQPMNYYLNKKLKNESYTQIRKYIGFRVDESSRALTHQNESSTEYEIYPFIKNAINFQDVHDILINSGIGIPEYYKYRKRSGCYFCIFQRLIDWVRLYKFQPELYKKAMTFENHFNKKSNKRFGFSHVMSLKEIIKPENMTKILSNHDSLLKKQSEQNKNIDPKLIDFFTIDDDEEQSKCKMCHL